MKETKDNVNEPLDFSHVAFAFGLLIIGLIFAMLSFLHELLRKAFKTMNKLNV